MGMERLSSGFRGSSSCPRGSPPWPSLSLLVIRASRSCMRCCAPPFSASSIPQLRYSPWRLDIGGSLGATFARHFAGSVTSYVLAAGTTSDISRGPAPNAAGGRSYRRRMLHPNRIAKDSLRARQRTMTCSDGTNRSESVPPGHTSFSGEGIRRTGDSRSQPDFG